MELTRFGLWIGRTTGQEHHGEAARLAEELGFGALWLGGSPRLTQLRPMLEATERIAIASGIVNVWAYEPDELAREFAELEADFPGRVLLGLGIGHPEATAQYEQPLTKMRSFLDGIAGSSCPVPPERMALAALGPRMLDLSAERTLGAHPYFTPPAHTRFARERLGADALVAPEQAVVLDRGDRAAAHEVARRYAEYYLRLTNYATALRRLGYDERALAEPAPSLVDEIVPQGSAEQVAAVIRAHLAAGADHVCVQTLQAPGNDGVPAEDWRALAATLLG
ncbi:MAG TPA: TIGR03620 family F420-dependent LLM class oxidoreductase [Solirubrobacteraceae bacterium]|nr:TIGR03620 family F420-dependent LLM class oxidoreductase [Solirubrobacteraceae bacterium]